MGSLTYHIPLNLRGRFEIGADVSFQTAAYTSSAINPQTRILPQTYINAMASWISPDRRWSVQATGRNLLDRRYIQSESLGLMKETTKSGATVYAPYCEAAYFADPRTIFVSAKYSF
jgi:iron complex outermembrane receptor protein